MQFHLLTGEYPPESGGVSDYTAQLASALAREGSEVHVWSPGKCSAPEIQSDGVVVHRLAGCFDLAALIRLGEALDRFPRSRTLLVQYVPHAFGLRNMNLPLCLWLLARRRRGDDVRVMFHEVAFPYVRRPLKWNLLAVVHRLMAAVLMRAARITYVSTPAWSDLLRRCGGLKPTIWLPIPANIPNDPQPAAASAFRSMITHGDSSAQLVGHFGTYGPEIAEELRSVLDRLLIRSRVYVALLGRRSNQVRENLLKEHASWADRIFASGGLPPPELAAGIQACDLMLQPYPEGVTTRRGSIMAALANGVPVVTTRGALSEPLWEGAVALTEPGGSEQCAVSVLRLLAEPCARKELARRGRELYECRFALRHTVNALLGKPVR